LWPPPFEISSPLQLSFEYISTDWISLQGGAANPPNPPQYASEWANDTDISALNDRALIEGLKWMFWYRKGFNALAEQAWWVDLVDRLIARDGAAPTLQLAKRVHPIFLSPANVQDGFFLLGLSGLTQVVNIIDRSYKLLYTSLRGKRGNQCQRNRRNVIEDSRVYLSNMLS
jgi:hypothetical protein